MASFFSIYNPKHFKHYLASADSFQPYLTDNVSEVLVEGQITSLHLNVSAIWLGKSLDAMVLENEAKGKSLLFYSWDPDPLTTSDKFKRVTFPDCR